MNDEKPQQIQPSEPPENNTAPPVPPPSASGQWQMPKPVFKKTSGYLPQGFEKIAAFEPAPSQPAAAAAAAPQTAGYADIPLAEEHVPVGEQPDILEDISDGIVETVPVAVKRSGSVLRILIGVFVVLLVVAIVAAFLSFIYYWFLAGDVSYIG